MQQRYALCSIGILLASLGSYLPRYLEPKITIKEEWFTPPPDASAETLLAMGEKIPFPCADMSDLLLIPGLSDKSAAALIEKREEILAHAAAAPPGDVRAFTLVHGIGEKRAAILGRYLSFEQRQIAGGCREYAPFNPSEPFERDSPPTPPSHSSLDSAADPHLSHSSPPHGTPRAVVGYSVTTGSTRAPQTAP